MQSQESLLQELASRFSSSENSFRNVGRSGQIFTPFRNINRKPSNDRIKNQIFKRFEKEQYKELESDLNFYKSNISLQDFFSSEEGVNVLYWVINNMKNDKPLKFLVENVEKEALSQALKDDNFYSLKSFLIGESGVEEAGLYDHSRGEFQIQIFKLLLSIDPKGVQEFMQSDIAKEYITENIDKNFKIAIIQYKQIPKQP